jgi:transcriptional regulator with XRE-family HTH domain
MKKLKIWLLNHDLTLEKMSQDLKVASSYIRAMLCGSRPLSKPIARKIEEYTKGEITASYLLSQSRKHFKDEGIDHIRRPAKMVTSKIN